jgi:hypothetical protein
LAPSRFSLKLPQVVELIIACAVVAALLWTPGAPLVVAIAIVLPGFFIDRLRGSTGIIGGVISSSILGVVLGITQMEFPGQDLFSDLVLAGPAVYFIFVISLIWGGLVSLTLYWVIKTCREHGQRTSAARHLKMQFSLGQLMRLIAVCAVVFAALSTPFALFVVAIGIVVPGFLFDRLRGGAGILGAMVSAAVVLVILGIAGYTYYYLHPDPALLDYLGPPALTLFMLGIAGVVWGAMVGTILDVVLLTAKSYSNAKPVTDDASPPIVWLPDATRER